MSKSKHSLLFEAQSVLRSKLRLCQSKAAAKEAAARAGETRLEGIYSWETYHSYEKSVKYYLRWCKQAHPDVRTLDDCKPYASEWLKLRADTKSVYTAKLDISALAKLYGCAGEDFGVKTAIANRDNITRSRGDAVRDSGYSEKNNAAFTNFCTATGCRRSDVENVRGCNYWTREQMTLRMAELEGKGSLTKDERNQLNGLKAAAQLPARYKDFVEFEKSKGGKTRFAPIVGEHKAEVITQMRSTPNGKRVWENIPSHADVHDFRREYATALYKENTRDYETCKNTRFWNPQHRWGNGQHRPGYDRDSVYRLKGSHKGEWLDKQAMRVSSLALGHNRISVVGEHYIKR